MSKFHLSEDGVVRPCEAESPATCTAIGPDGEKVCILTMKVKEEGSVSR